MTSSSSSATLKASASFAVNPAKSQVVLVALTVAVIFSLVIAGVLLSLDKVGGWAFVAFAFLLCGFVVWCWLQSHRDTDLAQAHPTKVVFGDGANFSTDSRLFNSPNDVAGFAQALAALAQRNPLPEPSGLAGPGAVPVPNTKLEAVALVAKLNASTQTCHDQALSLLQGNFSSNPIVQLPNDGQGPPPDATKGAGSVNSIQAGI